MSRYVPPFLEVRAEIQKNSFNFWFKICFRDLLTFSLYENSHLTFGQFYYSKMEVLQIAQLLAVVIYASASLMRENQRGLREILKRKIQPKTKKMQQITHDCIAFSPSAFGELVVVVLKMLTYRKKN